MVCFVLLTYDFDKQKYCWTIYPPNKKKKQEKLKKDKQLVLQRFGRLIWDYK